MLNSTAVVEGEGHNKQKQMTKRHKIVVTVSSASILYEIFGALRNLLFFILIISVASVEKKFLQIKINKTLFKTFN